MAAYPIIPKAPGLLLLLGEQHTDQPTVDVAAGKKSVAHSQLLKPGFESAVRRLIWRKMLLPAIPWFVSIPERTASTTWSAISQLPAPESGSAASAELASVAGIASSLISRDAMTSPIVVWGAGPRVRVYCLYNVDAVEGDDANETALSFDPTGGDWHMSLPRPAEDLSWVENALKGKSKRVTARDMEMVLDSYEEESSEESASETVVDLEAFSNHEHSPRPR